MDSKTKNRPRRTPPPSSTGATAPPPVRPNSIAQPSKSAPDTAAANQELGTLVDQLRALQDQVETTLAESKSLKTQLRQSQRLAALGTTAAMMAHEFNNLFTPVVAYAQHALKQDEPELMRNALGKTLKQTEIVRSMADRIVGMANQDDTTVKPLTLKPIIDNAVQCLCRDLSKDNISVGIQLDAGLKVRSNEHLLTQVLFNLIINARQAMLGRRGRLTIDAVRQGDDHVVINVRDTGCGIPAERIDRIFEPFYSTKTSADKPDRQGLGLGLAICKDIIEDVQGAIAVQSHVDVGTTFTLTLPAAD